MDLPVRLRVEGGLQSATSRLVARPPDAAEQREADHTDHDERDREEVH